MNLVALVGNLATDPELRHTEGGKAVCTFRLAVSRSSNTEADFFTVVTWERQAEICKQYLSVGRRIAVDGRLHHSTWTVGEGENMQRRSKVEVIAHRVEMLGPRREQTGRTAEDAPDEIVAAEPPTPEFAIG
jgi:single-strand DNA-binding protein